ncbi:hypothetical protein [Endozoicomonas sp.]|uniref:hypothetical protein n=1 Tax=Endozoicomonas sp. TaxID=1892382 RepID=UPI002885D431|nr:hypothetical protein [Endozoicomonas sp.]
MKGVNSHQPVKLTPTANNKAQNTNKTEGSFSRFKVRIPDTIKQFLSSIFSVKTPDASIRSRVTGPANPTLQKPVSNAEKNSHSPSASHKFDQALQQATNNQNAKTCFSEVSTALEALQVFKSDMRHLPRGGDDFRMCRLNVQMTKHELQEAVKNFNSAASPDLQLDSSTLEMAILNKNNTGNLDFARHDQNYKQYEQMKNALL